MGKQSEALRQEASKYEALAKQCCSCGEYLFSAQSYYEDWAEEESSFWALADKAGARGRALKAAQAAAEGFAADLRKAADEMEARGE